MTVALLAFETALHDWIRANVPANVAIIFAEQDGPRPPFPYVSVRIEGPRRVGGADELRYVTNLSNPAGQEVEQTVAGQRELTVLMQAFSDRTLSSGAAWAASTAYQQNAFVTNGGNVYQCTTAGTSAASGGPLGTGSAIADGTAVWRYFAVAVTARELLSGIQTSLALPTQLDNLYSAGGLVLQDQGSVQNISTVIETKWEGRAALSVIFRLTDSAVEKTGYVDGVIFGASGVGGTYTT